MGQEIIIDFRNIDHFNDFYTELEKKLHLPPYFGENLDALYDVLSGEVKLPLTLVFIHMTAEQAVIFKPLIDTLRDANREIEGFTFQFPNGE